MKPSEWLSGKCFNFVHGKNLVYNTCWEDPRLDRVALDLGPDVDLIVDGGRCPLGRPSTVIDVTRTPPALVRAGAVSLTELRAEVPDIQS